jgi:uncharacterized protein (DUF362 family)
MPSVAIVTGLDRYDNITRALDLLGSETICGTTHLIKPNFVSTEQQLASTHREAARAVLDFLRKHSEDPVIIAEGAAFHDTFDGFRNFGFNELVDTYNDVDLRDLNRDEYETFTLYDEALNPIAFRIAKTVLESDHRISLSIPKTHDTAIVTLSLKNMAVGSLIRNMGHSFFNLVGCVADRFFTYVPSHVKPFFSFQGLSRIGMTKISGSDKVRLHQGYVNMHFFLYQLIRIIPPHLSILDGFAAMEGDGPVSGNRVDWRIAIAGTDGIAVDAVAAHLMGFDLDSIGYLYFCGKAGLGETNIDNINIMGTNVEECRRTFRPHRSYRTQLHWKQTGERTFEKLRTVLEAKPA